MSESSRRIHQASAAPPSRMACRSGCTTTGVVLADSRRDIGAPSRAAGILARSGVDHRQDGANGTMVNRPGIEPTKTAPRSQQSAARQVPPRPGSAA